MNTLTEEERVGLEDVFLSISTSSSKINGRAKISHLFHKLLNHAEAIKIAKISLKLPPKARRSLKTSKVKHIMLKIVKKKKNLS